MLLELVIIACLSSSQTECREFSTITRFEDKQTCMLNAIPQAALWQAMNMKYKINKVYCRKALQSA